MSSGIPLMKKMRATLILVGLFIMSTNTVFGEWSGNLGFENRYFLNPPLFEEQHDNYLSLSFEPEYYRDIGDSGLALKFKPFFRLDEHDEQRTHSDIREFFLFYPN